MSTRFFPNYDKYIITSRFGQRVDPVTRVKKMHNGIDLVATKDGKNGRVDKIKAHTGGVVDGVGFDKDAGNFVRIKVDPDTKMYYFHLRDKSDLTVGEVVKAGDIIGIMGKTGKATGKHLHWGIKKNGKWIDPEPYLDKDYIKAADTVKIEMDVLERGAKGEQVKTLQNLLLSNGHDMEGYGADGSFGGATERAVKAYQKAAGLTADGVVGAATWNKLLKG